MYLCQVDSLGELYLDESSKEFLHQFCRTSSQVLVFVNAKGEFMHLKPSSKSYSYFHSPYNSFHPYPGDSTRNFGSCFGKEAVTFHLKSENPPFTIYIQLETVPNTIYPYDHKLGDVLSIFRQITPTSYCGEFLVIVNQRSLDREKYDYQEFYPEIKLNGKTFYNVLSLEVTHFQIRPYKYYYSKAIGLIGFEDLSGMLWVLAH